MMVILYVYANNGNNNHQYNFARPKNSRKAGERYGLQQFLVTKIPDLSTYGFQAKRSCTTFLCKTAGQKSWTTKTVHTSTFYITLDWKKYLSTGFCPSCPTTASEGRCSLWTESFIKGRTLN